MEIIEAVVVVEVVTAVCPLPMICGVTSVDDLDTWPGTALIDRDSEEVAVAEEAVVVVADQGNNDLPLSDIIYCHYN